MFYDCFAFKKLLISQIPKLWVCDLSWNVFSEMKPNRLPKILMQTACHVAGAGQFYQTEDCDQNLLPDSLKGRDQRTAWTEHFAYWIVIAGGPLVPGTRQKTIWLLHSPWIWWLLFNACCSLYWNSCAWQHATKKFATQFDSCRNNWNFGRIQ